MMNIVILDGYASNPGDLNWDLLEQLGNVTVYPRTNDDEKMSELSESFEKQVNTNFTSFGSIL